MRITIKNQARHLLLCTLNSGRTIYLSPAEISEALENLEINGNEKIAKLVQAGLVSIAMKDLEKETLASGSNTQLRRMEISQPADHLEIHGDEKIAAPAQVGVVSGVTEEFEDTTSALTPGPRVGKASLSRFQFLIFTLVIVSLYLLLSVQANAPVVIPANVLGLLGLSAGSYLVSKAMNSG